MDESSPTMCLTIALKSLADGPLGDPAVGGDGDEDLCPLLPRPPLLLDPLDLPHRAQMLAMGLPGDAEGESRLK